FFYPKADSDPKAGEPWADAESPAVEREVSWTRGDMEDTFTEYDVLVNGELQEYPLEFASATRASWETALASVALHTGENRIEIVATKKTDGPMLQTLQLKIPENATYFDFVSTAYIPGLGKRDKEQFKEEKMLKYQQSIADRGKAVSKLDGLLSFDELTAVKNTKGAFTETQNTVFDPAIGGSPPRDSSRPVLEAVEEPETPTSTKNGGAKDVDLSPGTRASMVGGNLKEMYQVVKIGLKGYKNPTTLNIRVKANQQPGSHHSYLLPEGVFPGANSHVRYIIPLHASVDDIISIPLVVVARPSSSVSPLVGTAALADVTEDEEDVKSSGDHYPDLTWKELLKNKAMHDVLFQNSASWECTTFQDPLWDSYLWHRGDFQKDIKIATLQTMGVTKLAKNTKNLPSKYLTDAAPSTTDKTFGDMLDNFVSTNLLRFIGHLAVLRLMGQNFYKIHIANTKIKRVKLGLGVFTASAGELINFEMTQQNLVRFIQHWKLPVATTLDGVDIDIVNLAHATPGGMKVKTPFKYKRNPKALLENIMDTLYIPRAPGKPFSNAGACGVYRNDVQDKQKRNVQYVGEVTCVRETPSKDDPLDLVIPSPIDDTDCPTLEFEIFFGKLVFSIYNVLTNIMERVSLFIVVFGLGVAMTGLS
ncbi:hypothetical protein CYMTET_16810, partial [Cymbomonas tetramitiformis]